jgi:hypothetical protein
MPPRDTFLGYDAPVNIDLEPEGLPGKHHREGSTSEMASGDVEVAERMSDVQEIHDQEEQNE